MITPLTPVRAISDRCTDPCGGLDFMDFDFPAWLMLIPVALISLVIFVVVGLIQVGRRELEIEREVEREVERDRDRPDAEAPHTDRHHPPVQSV